MAPLLLSTGRQGLGGRHLLPGAFPQPLPRALSLCCLLTSMGLLEASRMYPVEAPQLPRVMTGEAFRWALKKSLPSGGL